MTTEDAQHLTEFAYVINIMKKAENPFWKYNIPASPANQKQQFW